MAFFFKRNLKLAPSSTRSRSESPKENMIPGASVIDGHAGPRKRIPLQLPVPVSWGVRGLTGQPRGVAEREKIVARPGPAVEAY